MYGMMLRILWIEYLKESEIMLGNEVKLLKKENAKQSEKLNEEDKIIISNIMKNMSIFKVNSYDAQVIRRDLVGMAQEFRLRDSSLKQAIGDDIKGFTNEIINNSNGPSKLEIFLGFLIKASLYFVLSFGLLALVLYGKLTFDSNPVIYLLYAGMVLISFTIDGIITPIYNLEEGIKRHIPSLITTILFISLTIVVFVLNDRENTIKINAGYIIAISGLLYLVSQYLNNKNIQRLAKDRKNYIEDLIN